MVLGILHVRLLSDQVQSRISLTYFTCHPFTQQRILHLCTVSSHPPYQLMHTCRRPTHQVAMCTARHTNMGRILACPFHLTANTLLFLKFGTEKHHLTSYRNIIKFSSWRHNSSKSRKSLYGNILETTWKSLRCYGPYKINSADCRGLAYPAVAK